MTNAYRPVVAVLESRMSRELARLVEKHGGEPLCVPAVREGSAPPAEATERLIDELCLHRYDLVVFLTGVAVSRLFELAEQLGRRPDLVEGLRRTTTACRGPKPTAALRGFGVPPTLTAREPFTSAELIDALNGLDLKDKRVLLFHYGERSATIAETLRARQAELHEQWLYRWLMPDDTTELDGLVRSILAGRVDALAVTCQIQFRHLMQVAARASLDRELASYLDEQVVMAAIGPTCHAVLQAHGVRVQVMPEHPKMGPLVKSLMLYLEHHGWPAETSKPLHAELTH